MNHTKAIVLTATAAAVVVAVAVAVIIIRRRNRNQKTGRGLVRYAKSQLGRPYWWGTNGQTADQALLDKKRQQWPGIYRIGGDYEDAPSQFGQRVHDCAGLIEAYMWSVDGSKNGEIIPGSNGFSDTTADRMYDEAPEKGPIDTLPEIPGLMLHRSGHAGVYIGNGEAIEARGHEFGVVRTRVADRGWTGWAKVRGIKY